MSAKSADEIHGYEFDWLASDGDGHVALFSTAGGGYAPEAFLADTCSSNQGNHGLVALHQRAVCARVKPPVVNTWKMAAERGLFAFDGDPDGGPYYLVAAPEVPATAAQFPAIVVDVLRDLEFRHLRIAGMSVISEEDLSAGRQ